jgi:outer membrane protein OmpA-like peptidoglycan-associated protein
MNYKTVTKKGFVLLLLCALIGLPACGKKTKKNKQATTKKHTKVAKNSIHIPLEHNMVAFDEPENIAGLFANDETAAEIAKNDNTISKDTLNEYTWTEIPKDEDHFKTVYFDFDKHAIRVDQKEVVTYDAEQLKQLLAEARQDGKEPIVVIEGHSCHSAGSDEYNLAKSQNRANAVFKVIRDLGVPTENIKVVGRGKDIPAVVNGKTVTGSRTQQWANRRVELHIVKA